MTTRTVQTAAYTSMVTYSVAVQSGTMVKPTVWQYSLGPWLDLQCGSAVWDHGQTYIGIWQYSLGPWLDLHWNMAVQSGTMVRPTV